MLASYELNVGALTTRVLILIGQILKSDLDPDQSRTQLLPTVHMVQTRAKSGYKIRPNDDIKGNFYKTHKCTSSRNDLTANLV